MSGQQLLGTRVLPSSPILPFMLLHTHKKRPRQNWEFQKLFLHWKTEAFGVHWVGAAPRWAEPRPSLQSSKTAVGPFLGAEAASGVGVGHPRGALAWWDAVRVCPGDGEPWGGIGMGRGGMGWGVRAAAAPSCCQLSGKAAVHARASVSPSPSGGTAPFENTEALWPEVTASAMLF